MSIVLAAELLTKIGESRKRFENDCLSVKRELLELGKVFNSKIDDEEYFTNLMMDTDF
jgi:hypothetical protein